MNTFTKPTRTMEEVMQERGFTLFIGNETGNALWVARFADGNEAVNGQDAFAVIEVETFLAETWEKDVWQLNDLTDDEIGNRIANNETDGFNTITGTPVEDFLFK